MKRQLLKNIKLFENSFKSLKNSINEEHEQLDISILSADKALKSKSDIENLLNSNVTIEHKTDGTKLTVVHVKNNGNVNDWILSYKGHILYSEEFAFQDLEQIKKKSNGSSQYKIVLEHFSNLGKVNIPLNFEFAIEFLQRKQTLSSNYTDPHHLVLIGYSKCNYTEEFGTLKTDSKVMNTEYRDEYAKELKIDVPNKLFNGKMCSLKDFEKGIINPVLEKEFNKVKDNFDFEDIENVWKNICSLLLSIESKYGGKEEGVVIKYNNKIIKVQQEYQTDQDARRKIKEKFKMDPEKENQYWKNVVDLSKKLASQCNTGTFQMRLFKLSELLEKTKLNFTHDKKDELQIKDDIQIDAKLLIQKNLEGNNGCLILGKFRILTKGHCNVINLALKEYDKVVVCLVTGKDTKFSQKLRLEMLKKTYGNSIEIIEASTGLISTLLRKSPCNINTVFCGSDRYLDYVKQLQTTVGLTVREYPRDNNSISATKVLANLSSEKFFKENTPKEIHKMYDEILLTYNVTENCLTYNKDKTFLDYFL